MNKIQDKKIAISISETPEALTKGIGKAMFDDLSVEIARHLLVTGAKLVYGGDLRIGGFTKLFMRSFMSVWHKKKSLIQVQSISQIILLGLYLIGSQNLTSLNLNTTVWK